MWFMFTDIEERMFQKACFPMWKPNVWEKNVWSEKQQFQLSNLLAEPNYTHQNLQSEAPKLLQFLTSVHIIRTSSKPRIYLRAVKTIWYNKKCYSALSYITNAAWEERFLFLEISFSCCQTNSKLQAATLHWPALYWIQYTMGSIRF